MVMKNNGYLVVLPNIYDDVVNGVWLVVHVQNERLVKALFNMYVKEALDIVFRERCSVLENKSLAVRGKFLAILLDESARMLGMRYMNDVSVLFEKDSEDRSGKSGEISEDAVKLGESKAINGIRYGTYASGSTEKDSNDEENRNFSFQGFRYLR